MKAQLIGEFGSVTRAARHFRCHPNALRLAVSGKCPRIAAKLGGRLS